MLNLSMSLDMFTFYKFQFDIFWNVLSQKLGFNGLTKRNIKDATILPFCTYKSYQVSFDS